MSIDMLKPLNDIFSKSEKYNSFYKNPIFENLAIPHEVYVKKQPVISIENLNVIVPIIYNNSGECIDDKLCSEFIKSVDYIKSPKSKTIKFKLKPKTKTKNQKTKKSKKSKN